MPDRSTPPEWLSERTGLALLTLGSIALATLILLPYLQYILLGVVLAYVLMPAQRRLEPAIGSMTAALALVAVAILAIVLPILYVLAIALREGLELLAAVQDGSLGMGEIEQQLEDIGVGVDLADLYGAYEEQIGTIAQRLATSGIELVTGLPGLLIGLTVTLFVLFALLRDGDRLIAWLQRVVPVDDEIQRELLAELDQLMWASVVGNVLVAAIQAVALGFGLVVLGVPAVVFLTVSTFVLALLPLIGAFGVWVPVAIYLALTGDFVGSGAMVVYGSIVSASDTYLRPALIGRTSAFNSAIIVVGIFGGLVFFGAVGLFIGPVVLGGAKVTLDVFARERNGEPVADPDLEGGAADDPAVDTEEGTGIWSEADEQTDAEPGETRAREPVPETDAEASNAIDTGDDPETDTDGETVRNRGADVDDRATGSETNSDDESDSDSAP